MDWSKKKKPKVVSESCEDIQTKCGCITLKGVLHCYHFEEGYVSNVVEMTSPYAGKKWPIFMRDGCYTLSPEAGALQNIYKKVLRERRQQRYLARNKAKIAELLPMWFEYDAKIGYTDAVERKERREIIRKARTKEMSSKDVNKNLSSAHAVMEIYRRSATLHHNRRMNRALRISGLQNLEFDYGDACRLFGKDIWEQLLVRTEHTTDVIDDVWKCLFDDFAFLYNIELPEFEKGDIVKSIGFGNEFIATALYRNGEIVAVGAIDNVRGRKALRALVGDKRLVEILPKKVYNAVTRHESFYVRGSLYYRRFNMNQVITID